MVPSMDSLKLCNMHGFTENSLISLSSTSLMVSMVGRRAHRFQSHA